MRCMNEIANCFKALMNNEIGLKEVASFPGTFRELIMIIDPPKQRLIRILNITGKQCPF